MIRIIFAAILAACPVLAAPVRAPHVTLELVSEQDAVKPGQPVWVGVRLQMEPGWRIYWRNPGETGTPTAINWKLPRGYAVEEVLWPLPERISEESIVTYEYSGTVLLMARIIPPASPVASPLRLGAAVSWLACKDMCVQGKAELSLALPAGGGEPGVNAGLFSRNRARVPGPVPSGWQVSSSVRDGKIALTFSGTGSLLRRPVGFIPIVPGQVNYGAPQVFAGEPAGWTLVLAKSDELKHFPDFIWGVVTSGSGAWEVSVPLNRAGPAGSSRPGPVNPGTPGVGLWWAFVLAFIGGMILNLMPCVFPILSIKVLGFVRESSHKPQEVRLHGLLYGLGVIVSFWVLALLLILLRAGGQHLGWGFQLQSPTVILLMAVIMFLLALNLLGVFEAGTSIARTTGKFRWTEGRTGAFFTGILATFLATPCTGPFMGTAVGFAATQPAIDGLLVFTGLGLGMAIPYVALSFAPRFSDVLPKPGRWMESFKQLMAFPLLGTVIWLLWVLGLQAGLNAVIGGLGCLLVAGVAGWLYGRWHTGVMRIVAGVLIAGGVVLATRGIRDSAPMGTPDVGAGWQEYSRARLAQLLEKGQPVFVDFTAAWCLTCKVNEMGALGTGSVREAFLRHKVVLLKADWTNPNPDIETALAEFGRNGVPLYLLYPGGKGNPPRVLPQILTPQKILAELESLPKRD